MSGVYYPSLVCNLIMRFDEALLSGSATPAPKSAEELASGAGVSLPQPPAQAAALLDGTKDRLSHVLAVMPRSGSFELPGYRQAGKFKLEFAWRDLPIDPRAIRSMAVEIYLGTVSAMDFARGMRGETDSGRLASIIATEERNLMMVGVVDQHEVHYTEKDSSLSIEGRDLRGIFLDAPIAPSTLASLNTNQPIDALVKDILGKAPQGERVPVAPLDPADWGGVPPPTIPPGVVNRVSLGAQASRETVKKKSGKPTVPGQASSVSFWDLITNFCLLVGVIPYFKGHKLYLRPARSLYDQANVQKAGTPGHPTPFKDGKARTIQTPSRGVDISFRRMIYGRNILDLSFSRKLAGKAKVPTVVCISANPDARGMEKLVKAEWPDVAKGADPIKVAKAKVTNVDPSGQAAATDQLVISVPGITSKERLRDIAQQIYEEIGRGEFSGACSSKNLASLGGDNADADIVRLRPGDAVEFLVDNSGVGGLPPVVSELNTQAAQSVEQAAKSLAAKLGGRTDLAALLVGISRGSFAKLQNTFRVQNVKYTWDVSKGVAVDFDFQNYIEARYDVMPSVPDAKIGTAALATKQQAIAQHKRANPPGSSPVQKKGGT